MIAGLKKQPRDCPMCHTPAKDDGTGVIVTVEAMLTDKIGEQIEIGYSVRCCECGTSVSDEYLEDAVDLWNGEKEQ